MANPFSITPAIATQAAQQGFGKLGSAMIRSAEEEKAQQELDDLRKRRLGFMEGVRNLSTITDPKEHEAATRELIAQYPQQSKEYYQALKQQRESDQVGQPKAITPSEKERFRIEDEKLKLRNLELKAQQASTDLERRKLVNQIKLQSQKIDENERKAIAEQKGPSVQDILGKAKEGEKKAASFADRMMQSSLDLNKLEQTIDPTDRFISMIAGSKGVIAELANRQASPEEQQYATAASDFVTAQLRKESGAVIGDEEFERKYREFFPMPGDKEEQIESKRQRRIRAAQNMVAESGGLYDVLYGKKPETQVKTAPQGAIEYLRSNPQAIDQFVAKYGYRPEGF